MRVAQRRSPDSYRDSDSSGYDSDDYSSHVSESDVASPPTCRLHGPIKTPNAKQSSMHHATTSFGRVSSFRANLIFKGIRTLADLDLAATDVRLVVLAAEYQARAVIAREMAEIEQDLMIAWLASTPPTQLPPCIHQRLKRLRRTAPANPNRSVQCARSLLLSVDCGALPQWLVTPPPHPPLRVVRGSLSPRTVS